ncbi:HAD family hydrolase [Bdellovibrio bacteriovorus]|uniref:HAD family hydrolase n=1 Tax=Bdellovibrio bacteriovorus TaxID=959 RepID=UPI0005A0CF91|nr:HAD family hydrolase [Bdellovibrio bacteriovorus]
MNTIKYVLLDVAGTLINKPELYPTISKSLSKFGYNLDENFIEQQHKLLTELIKFPDNTDQTFYKHFNQELLYALGIEPSEELVNHIYTSCKKLKWHICEDSTEFLNSISLPKGILSNWDLTLEAKLKEFFPDVSFNNIFGSAQMQASKPSQLFFNKALKMIDLDPREILYIGDSIKLDIAPGKKHGLNTILIDRNNIFKNFKGVRVTSFNEVTKNFEL